MITPQLFRLICVLGPSIISLATTGVINTQVSNIADEISNNFLENNNQSAQTSLQVNRAHAIGVIAVGLMPVKNSCRNTRRSNKRCLWTSSMSYY